MDDTWTGDEWRWHTDYHDEPSIYTITVYELEDPPEPDPSAQRVPFGFSDRSTLTRPHRVNRRLSRKRKRHA